MFTKLTATLFVLLLVVVVPILSSKTARRLRVRDIPRLALYLSAAISQWLLAALCLAVVLLTSRGLLLESFGVISLVELVRWVTIVTAACLGGLGAVIWLENRGLIPQESELVRLLIPETRREKLWAVLILAPTAAFCEEFVYRGYLLTELSHWFHSLIWAWVISSVAFGLAHAYQGWSGMTRAALLGALLAYPFVRLGNLYPSMLAHGLIDAVALAWLGPLMVRQEKSPTS
jgi:membrane protease YdiL (CAAX protease family)